MENEHRETLPRFAGISKAWSAFLAASASRVARTRSEVAIAELRRAFYAGAAIGIEAAIAVRREAPPHDVSRRLYAEKLKIETAVDDEAPPIEGPARRG